jgi:hypothetical protein
MSVVGLPSRYPAILDVVSSFFQLVCSNRHTSKQFRRTRKFLKSCTSSGELCFNMEGKTKHESTGKNKEGMCNFSVPKYGIYDVSFSTYKCIIMW